MNRARLVATAGCALLAIFLGSSTVSAQDQPALNKPPLEPIPRVGLKKIEPLPPVVKSEQTPTKTTTSGWVTKSGWINFDSTITYPMSHGDKPSEWNVLAISPDNLIITFVDKNAVKRKGDVVRFDSWRFGTLPKMAIAYDSMVMTLMFNCKSMKGSLEKIYLLRRNRVISEDRVDLEGFDPGTEPYASGQTVCAGAYNIPIPVQPDMGVARILLESIKAGNK